MATMNVSLPDEMKEWVEARAKARGFMSSSEYLRDLIREQREIEEFEAKIVAGMTSGGWRPAEEVTEELRARVAAFRK